MPTAGDCSLVMVELTTKERLFSHRSYKTATSHDGVYAYTDGNYAHAFLI